MEQPETPEATPDRGPVAPATGKPPLLPAASKPPLLPKEIGGVKGPEPTRFGDWERNGRCIDF